MSCKHTIGDEPRSFDEHKDENEIDDPVAGQHAEVEAAAALASRTPGTDSSPLGSGRLTAMAQDALPWHCLYFFPDPHGHGSLRPTLRSVRLNGAASAGGAGRGAIRGSPAGNPAPPPALAAASPPASADAALAC